MNPILLRRATIIHTEETGQVSHRPCDIRIADGVIAEIGELTPVEGERVESLDGHLVVPAAVEPHAHLDKAFLSERIENPEGDLMGAITAMQANRHLIDVEDTIERAERAARLMARNGYYAVRSHADTTVAHGLRSIEALTEVKRRVADVIDLEIVSLIGWPLLGPDGADQRALAREAAASGVDLIGGVPHLEAAGVRAATEWILDLATEHGLGVDFHTDETLDPTVMGLEDLADLKLQGFDHPVAASHCVSLGMQTSSEQQRISELVAEAGISVISLPHTNLFLQGRGHAPMPRGLTAVAALRAAGVNVAAGADNLQDPFNPVGKACPFETAGLMIMASHALPHDAWSMVTERSAIATNRTPAAITPGAPAHLISVQAETVREAIAMGPTDRRVWRHGVEVGRVAET